MKYATAVREQVRRIPRGETFSLPTIYRIGRIVKPECDPIAPSAEKASLRCVLQRLRDNEGLLFLRTPGFYRWPLTDRKAYSGISGEELLRSIAPNANVRAVTKASTPVMGREEVPMLSSEPTSFSAAYAKAEAEKSAKLNRSKKLEGKAGFYDGKAIDMVALNAALAIAQPVHPNCPVLTPAILKNYIKRATPDKQLNGDFTIIALMAEYIMSVYEWERNRDLDKNRLARWESFMIEGSWNLDGTPIKFNDLEELHNGRHRMTASANSGKPFATNLRFGVPKATFKTEDTGKEWRPQDVFKLDGWKHYQLIPHMVRGIVNYNAGDFDSRDTNVSNDARLTQARGLGKRKLEKCAETAKKISRYLNSAKRKEDERYRLAAQYFGQAYYIAMEIDEPDADEWFAKWAVKPSIIQKIAAELMHGAPGQGHDTICRAIPILAWNLYRNHPRATAAEARQALHWRLDCPHPKAV